MLKLLAIMIKPKNLEYKLSIVHYLPQKNIDLNYSKLRKEPAAQVFE